jgi:hypothetical protein
MPDAKPGLNGWLEDVKAFKISIAKNRAASQASKAASFILNRASRSTDGAEMAMSA